MARYNRDMAIEKIVTRTTFRDAERKDKAFWMSRTPGQRIDALTTMVNAYLDAQDESSQRLQRVYRIVRRPQR